MDSPTHLLSVPPPVKQAVMHQPPPTRLLQYVSRGLLCLAGVCAYEQPSCMTSQDELVFPCTPVGVQNGSTFTDGVRGCGRPLGSFEGVHLKKGLTVLLNQCLVNVLSPLPSSFLLLPSQLRHSRCCWCWVRQDLENLNMTMTIAMLR